MLLAADLGADSSITLGFLITLLALGSSIAAGIFSSRLLQGRTLRDLEKWRNDEADPQLKTLMDEHTYVQRRQKELNESSSPSTAHGKALPYTKAHQ